MKQTRAIALCGVTAALAVVLMTVGGLLGIGLYAAPMLAGLCLLPAGRHLGLKYHLTLWLAVSALSFLLLALGNLTFALYDRLIPRAQRFLETRLAAFLR